MLDKKLFQTVAIFSFCLLIVLFLTEFHLCSNVLAKSLILALTLGGTLKTRVFEKINHFSKDVVSSRFGMRNFNWTQTRCLFASIC